MGERKQYNVNNPRLKEFTDRFRIIVDKFGGVTEVSRVTRISRPTINFWYNGERTPDAESLIKLSEALGVPSDYLLGLIDSQSRDLSTQAVHSATGLSTWAITKIYELKQSDPRLINVLSALVEDNNAAFFLSLMETLFSLESPDIEKEKVSMDISGKSLDLYQDNLLKAVLQAKLVENIPNVAKIYSVLTEEGGNNG